MRGVDDPLPHLADFQLAQKCLDGDELALALLPKKFVASVVAFLIRSGATAGQAHEIVDSLWADCLAVPFDKPAALSRYNGSCALLTWLNTIAFNHLITQRRAAQRWNRLIPLSADDERTTEAVHRVAAVESPQKSSEPPLLEILRIAVQTAFANCRAEHFVLLQLVHHDGLRMAELAKMFRCSEATIRRNVALAAEEMQAATLAQVKVADPWIELTWEDFLELCRTASPSMLGME